MSHTPGPWRLGLVNPVDIVDDEGILVANTRYNPPARYKSREQMEANARFIVQACNAHEDLLEAAKATLALWDKHGLGDEDSESEPIYHALKNAIAKAEGR